MDGYYMYIIVCDGRMCHMYVGCDAQHARVCRAAPPRRAAEGRQLASIGRPLVLVERALLLAVHRAADLMGARVRYRCVLLVMHDHACVIGTLLRR